MPTAPPYDAEFKARAVERVARKTKPASVLDVEQAIRAPLAKKPQAWDWNRSVHGMNEQTAVTILAAIGIDRDPFEGTNHERPRPDSLPVTMSVREKRVRSRRGHRHEKRSFAHGRGLQPARAIPVYLPGMGPGSVGWAAVAV